MITGCWIWTGIMHIWLDGRQVPAACNTSSCCPQCLDVTWYLINQDTQFWFDWDQRFFLPVNASERTDLHKIKKRSLSFKQHTGFPQNASSPHFSRVEKGALPHLWTHFCACPLKSIYLNRSAAWSALRYLCPVGKILHTQRSVAALWPAHS